MTNEEAADLLKRMQITLARGTGRVLLAEALGRAISALEKQTERKRGRWVEEPNCTYRCSQCGEHYQSIRGYMYHNFCPNCGADMRGE